MGAAGAGWRRRRPRGRTLLPHDTGSGHILKLLLSDAPTLKSLLKRSEAARQLQGPGSAARACLGLSAPHWLAGWLSTQQSRTPGTVHEPGCACGCKARRSYSRAKP
ncbi:unnamed protein product [Urochloa humidicola]